MGGLAGGGSEWRSGSGGVAEWHNGIMAEWQSGGWQCANGAIWLGRTMAG